MSKMTLTIVAVLAMAGVTRANVFNMPTGLTSLETVPVGNPLNAPDPETGFGAVDYAYRVGTFEVTAGQYAEFLNAVATTDAYGLYNTNMWGSIYGCKIRRTGTVNNYTYTVAADRANRPVNYVSWGDSARFANWLHNGQPTGVQDLTTTEDGAYFVNGALSTSALLAIDREADWTWAITSEDEWYKAAHHKNDGVLGNYFDYPTSSDSVPSNDLIDPDPGNNATFNAGGYTLGSPYYRTEAGAHENSDSPYGTFDMCANVWEWTEAIPITSNRGIRGGSFSGAANFLPASLRHYYAPRNETYSVGFRVANVPEPASMMILALGGLGVLRRRR